MKRPKFTNNWAPSNAKATQVGRMVCCTCNQKIQGFTDFQYRQKSMKDDWAYQSQHAKCASNKDDWKKLRAFNKFLRDCSSKAQQIVDEVGLDDEDQNTVFCLLREGYSITKGSE